MCISQRSKNCLNDDAVAISPTSSTISIDGSGGYGIGIGSVEGNGE